jgi:hypothetical protein
MKKAKITISILAVMVAFVAFGAQKSEAAFSLSLGFGGGSIGFNSGYGYDDYGYDDYGYGGYDDYGYDNYGYGYDDYGYDNYGYDNYGYDYDYMQPAYSGYGGNNYYTNNYNYGHNPCNCGGGNYGNDYGYSGSIAPTYGYYGGSQSSQYTRYPQQYGYGYGNQDTRMCFVYGC